MKQLVNAEPPLSVLNPKSLVPWTRGDAEAEVRRVLESGLTLRAYDEFERVRQAIERVGETSGHEDVAREGLEELQLLLPRFVPPVPSAWIEHVCERCGYTCGVRRCDVMGLGMPPACPRCRALAAEARLVPGQADAWWTETMQKGEHVAEQLARLGHPGWDCLPLSTDHMDADSPAHVVTRSQILFRGEYLVVDPDTADGLLLDLRIGNRSQSLSGEPIPLSVFNPKNWGSLDAMREAAHFRLDVACVAQDITLVVLLHQPGPFRATLWGRSERGT